MGLLEKIIVCKNEEDIKRLIDESLQMAKSNLKEIQQSYFIDKEKTQGFYKGFIPEEIEIEGLNNDNLYYGNIIQIFYDFGIFVNKMKMKNEVAFIHYIEYFLEELYGPVAENDRINEKQSLKKAILANQLLSLFGFDSYCCFGYVDNNEDIIKHAFNIIKRKTNYSIVDYGYPIHSYKFNRIPGNNYPFLKSINPIEFKKFINDGEMVSFNDYKIVENRIIEKNDKRIYSLVNTKDKEISRSNK